MPIIFLTHGKTASVCDCHYDLVKDNKWHYKPDKLYGGYAARTINHGKGKFESVKMHRLINNTPKGFDTDHENGNKLDNHCLNLRTATRMQNGANAKMFNTNTSGVKGVGWMKQHQKWRADIGYNNKLIYLGLFDTIEEATRARKAAEAEYHREFARC